MNTDEPTEEEKVYLSQLIALIVKEGGSHLSSPFVIRFKKCDLDWDKFFLMHQNTATPLPRMVSSLLEAIRLPFEDLPLYLNTEELPKGGAVKDFKLITIIKARLKLGK